MMPRVLWLALLLFGLAQPAWADRMELIEKRGAVVIGVKTDFPPFGMLDSDGRLVGFEVDMATDFARRLGVSARLVGVSSANRLQKLEDGEIDLLIATLGDTSERRKIATIVEPPYYASGATVLLRPGIEADEWADLRGKTICATQGALYNKPMRQRFMLDLKVYNGTRDPLLALRNGACAGWLYDATAIANEMKHPDLAGYRAPLGQVLTSPWAAAVARSERGGALERAVGDAIADWHREGFLLELERKWAVPPTRFLADARDDWSRKDPAGAWLCQRQPSGEWNAACRNPALLTPSDVNGLYRLALQIREAVKLDITVLYDPYDQWIFLRGILLTLQLVAVIVLGTLVAGAVVGAVLGARIPVVSQAFGAVIAVIRTTPPLLQIYIFYFWLGAVAADHGFEIGGFFAAAMGLALYNGAALGNVLAEAASVARERHSPLGRAGLVETVRLAWEPLVSIAINGVRMTGMASTVAVPEVINAAAGISSEHGNADVMMNLLMVVYVVIILIMMKLFAVLKKGMHRVAG
ncbi:MAG: ABC transporter permease subunit [Alphaproteobacteria bacterium]|nr:ABC transporter permease subunit [Alphaproteobacteria bacterium]